MIFILAVMAAMAGVCFAVQGPVNTALGKRTSAIQATTISFLGGMIACFFMVIIIGQGDLSKIGEASFWQFLGGLYGAINVCISVLAMPILGVALTLMSVLIGQLLMGAIIDGFGWFDTSAVPITPLRVIGIAIAVAGIVVIYYGSKGKEEKKENDNKSKSLLMLFLTLFSGALGSIQSPTNASLAGIVGNWESTFISFIVGFVAIFVALLIFNKGKILPMKNVGIKPWMLIGGLYGVGGVFLNLYTVTYLGAALQVSCLMVGQLTGGIIIDSFGLIQSEKIKVNSLRIIGVLVITLGVIIVTLAK